MAPDFNLSILQSTSCLTPANMNKSSIKLAKFMTNCSENMEQLNPKKFGAFLIATGITKP